MPVCGTIGDAFIALHIVFLRKSYWLFTVGHTSCHITHLVYPLLAFITGLLASVLDTLGSIFGIKGLTNQSCDMVLVTVQSGFCTPHTDFIAFLRLKSSIRLSVVQL